MAIAGGDDFLRVTTLTVAQLRTVSGADALIAEFDAIDWLDISAVVGKWPPQNMMSIDLSGHDWWRAEDALASAESTLSLHSGSELVAEVVEARSIVRDIAIHGTGSAAAVEASPAPEFDASDDAGGFASRSAPDTGITGKWPPDEGTSITGKWPPEV